ncbi:transmembrane protein 225 [Hippopotamus amphibius kiboko]|uniref:transmembrane protein 225 n=1 Tax=Hippopotamus amphibius kiboko TaxID=575201 RepID=UPI0025915AF8|nr:transmembrane protein 225 [Hippopotamus amphibius kiboko]
MVHVSVRKVQATNMFLSSWVLVFLAVGIIIQEWAELKLDPKTPRINHSPWICCTSVWPEGGLEVVRNMLILVFNFSFLHNLLLGFEFTYMIPQTKYILVMTACLAFLTGILLLCALLLYQQMLLQGESVYYSSYKITWIIFTAYLNVFFLIISGILSLLQHKQSIDSSDSLTTMTKSARESQVMEQSGASIKVISLPAGTAMPRSIVRVHSEHTKVAPKKPQVQERRVTWAL